MKNIKKFILEQVATKKIELDKAKEYLAELDVSASPQSAEQNEIAVIGMSGVFPKSDDLDEFWKNLSEGVNCIDDFPEIRKEDGLNLFKTPAYTEYLFGKAIDPAEVDNIFTKAGYLRETDKFDSDFFGIPPAEACYMDPCQRLVLQSAWHAMEDAGYGGENLYGSNTGVFIGKESTNFSLYRFAVESNPTQLTGSWESVIGSRISYLFDFKGPCMLVDTACSASLVSIHMAAQSIMNGECDIALAGGVNLIPGELKSQYQNVMNMDSVESGSGVVRTFDAEANGTVWGEGVGVVLLKPLAQAQRDGDNIHAVIKGSAINNDGSSNGLTAPNAESQEAVILKAWENADIEPDSIDYIEAHGTGTVLGDPIEFKGLTSAFRKTTNRNQFCAIGSLKTNMGHLVASSGIASLFKVIKSIQAKKIAPTINFNQPNPYINFVSSPLYVSDKLQDWESGETPRRAAINSFGFSHTNCHMVVEESPEPRRTASDSRPRCFTVSAKKQELLIEYIKNYQSFCSVDNWDFADLCFTASIGRGHYEHRLCIVATDRTEFLEKLNRAETVIGGSHASDDGVFYGSHKLVSDRKKDRSDEELTGAEKKTSSDEALKLLSNSGQDIEYSDVCLLADLYSRGADVQWSLMFGNERRIRQSQPTYPFERVRRWNTPKPTKVVTESSRIHPLIDRRVATTDTEYVYESEFTCDSHWILADHKIKGTSVVPGTTYLEMARAVASHALFINRVEIADIFFVQPMIVEAGEKRIVRSTLTKDENHFKFTIVSANADEVDSTNWVYHVEAKILEVSSEQLDQDVTTDLIKLKGEAVTFLDQYNIELDTGVFQFGPHWDSIRQTWTTADQSLAKLVIPEVFNEELSDFRIHPSMLDNAMNLTSQDGESTYLPFMYKSFKLLKPFTTEMYTIITAKNHVDDGAETHSYDVILTNKDGEHIAKIDGYITKKLNSFDFSNQTMQKNTHLQTSWKPLDPGDSVSLYDKTNSVLVLGNGGEAATQLSEALKDRGLEVSQVQLGYAESVLKYLSPCFEPTESGLNLLVESPLMDNIDAVVFATDYDIDLSGPAYTHSAECFAERKQLGVEALFHLGKNLIQSKRKLPGGLIVLSRSVYSVIDGEQAVNPLGAASAMFAKILDDESPGLNCYSIDVGESESVESVVDSFSTISPLLITGLRNQTLYCMEMQDVEPVENEEYQYQDDEVYVISGGLGGLGLRAAEHIASKAKSKVVLLGRSSFPDRDQWEAESVNTESPHADKCCHLLGIAKNLASLTYFDIDIADTEKVEQLAMRISSDLGPVVGVFHAAGVAGDGFVMNKSFSTFDTVLRPKLNGTRNLMSAFGSENLRFTVLYSSITAVVGGQGQSDYAAANAFLDALVETETEQEHGKLLSINWPSWEDVGMAVDFDIDHEQSPFAPIHSGSAMACFDKLVNSTRNRILPSTINNPVLASMLDSMPVTVSDKLKSQLDDTDSSVLNYEILVEDLQITGKSEDDLSVTEATLSKLYAGVLGISEIDIYANFQDMGGNSILATHLLKVIDKYYPEKVEISDIFSYPSVDLMAEYLSGGEVPMAVATEAAVDVEQPEISSWGDVAPAVTNSTQSEALTA